MTTQNQIAPATDIEPIALVRGEAYTKLPQDLYIPPDAMQVFLETFEGPLDLLLYLIRRHNLDILDIPIAKITHQYMEYVDLMKDVHLELAGEYLVMAAMLAEIKSRMLLPRPIEEEGDEADPRAELVRRLQEYERFRQVAEELREMPRMYRDIFKVSAEPPKLNKSKVQPQVDMKDLLFALADVMRRAELNSKHEIKGEVLSIRDRITQVLRAVRVDGFTSFDKLFTIKEGRMGVVVTFIAILELLKQSLIEMVQAAPYAPIHVKAIGEVHHVTHE